MIINSSTEMCGHILQGQLYSNIIFLGKVIKKKKRSLPYIVSRGLCPFNETGSFTTYMYTCILE